MLKSKIVDIRLQAVEHLPRGDSRLSVLSSEKDYRVLAYLMQNMPIEYLPALKDAASRHNYDSFFKQRLEEEELAESFYK